jgi:hypothetical protein
MFRLPHRALPLANQAPTQNHNRFIRLNNFLDRLLGLALLCAFPLSMLAYQYHSTQEIGFVSLDKIKLWHPGYYTWIRSWFAIEKIEYDRFAWDVGTANWASFDVANFPSRAFDSTEERNRMAELMVTWRTTGYSDSIDRGFQELGVEKFRQHPLRSFVSHSLAAHDPLLDQHRWCRVFRIEVGDRSGSLRSQTFSDGHRQQEKCTTAAVFIEPPDIFSKEAQEEKLQRHLPNLASVHAHQLQLLMPLRKDLVFVHQATGLPDRAALAVVSQSACHGRGLDHGSVARRAPGRG